MSTVYRFYNKLDDADKQICDLCIDLGLTQCNVCETAKEYIERSDKLIILYTIDCPNCIVLEKKLQAKNIEFLKVSDRDTIIAKGFGDSAFPILEVDGVTMSYKTAIQWINNQ